MTCSFSKEILALFAEGDLSGAEERTSAQHLRDCASCAQFVEQLRDRQSMLKSIRHDAVYPLEYETMRREVMAKVNRSVRSLGWMLRMERALIVGFGKRTYALAGLAILATISVSLLAQMRNPLPMHDSAALFEGKDTLIRPAGYRDWVLTGTTTGRKCAIGGTDQLGLRLLNNVYVERTAYAEYSKTGVFPEGTMIVLERTRPASHGIDDKQVMALAASVKDSRRFPGGWGFFDFTDSDGSLKNKTPEASDAAGCRSCHVGGVI